MASRALQSIREEVVFGGTSPAFGPAPAFPWKDPFSVPPGKLGEIIVALENACSQNPANAALHTFLGMAHAMNYDVYESMDALEAACKIAPQNFFAQFKYSELFFRLRLMDRAEEESSRALALANSGAEITLVRRQLSEIRRLKRKGVERTVGAKALGVSAAGIVFILLVISVFYMAWK
jgi:hypothetical protein